MSRLIPTRVEYIRKAAVEADFLGVCKASSKRKALDAFDAMIATLTPREIMELTMVWKATVINGDAYDRPKGNA